MNHPILVTGMHRSGTTWVGKTLAADPRQVGYISEPLNCFHRPGVMRAPVSHWYVYIDSTNEGDFLHPFQETMAFRYHLGREILSLRSRKDVGRMIRDATIFWRSRLWGARPLLKDPFAVFSLPWFIQRLHVNAVVTVRHPAAVVSSLKRLQWRFEVEDLLAQPHLMQGPLQSFRRELQRAVEKETDLITRGALLWKGIYAVVQEYRRDDALPFTLVRQEDLARAPIEGFRALYTTLGLAFTPRVQEYICQSTSAENPVEASSDNVYAVRLDSRASLKTWQKRLTPQEIDRIRKITEPVASQFYTDDDWY